MKKVFSGVMKHKRLLLLAFVVVLVLVAGQFGGKALRADPGSEMQGLATPGTATGGMIAKVILSLAFLVALLYGGVYALKRLSGKTGAGRLVDGAISVLHKQHIAPKKAIYILKVANRTMVVGVTDSQISHLADLSEQDLEGIRKAQRDERSFKRSLLGALGFADRG